MARGGAPKTREGPERRCLATGVSGPKAPLIRFVLDPEGRATPDLAEKLPGRGAWILADRETLATAVKKNLFARGFKQAVPRDPDLVERVEGLLTKRLIEALALARKAGRAVAGFEKCREGAPSAAAIFQASDGAEGGKSKLRRLAREVPEFNCLESGELGLAFGRISVIHAVLTSGGAASRAMREAKRLEGVRFGRTPEAGVCSDEAGGQAGSSEGASGPTETESEVGDDDLGRDKE